MTFQTKSGFASSHITSGVIIPLLVLAIVGIGYFLLLPKYQAIRADHQSLSQKQASTEALKSKLGSIKSLISDADKNKTELESLDEAIPDAPRIPELLANFDYLVQQSGLLLTNLNITLPEISKKPDQPKFNKRLESILSSTDNLGIIAVNVAVSGQYQNLKNFLLNLEQNLRLMDVAEITFGTRGSESQDTREYSLKIETYFQRND